MMRLVKHFLHQSKAHSVVCDWNFRTGQWICNSTLQGRVKAPDLALLRELLSAQGYEEINAEDHLRRASRMPKSAHDDRREQPRYDVVARTTLFVNSNQRVKAEVLNISRSGTLVESPLHLGEGCRFELAICLGNISLKPVKACVVHAHESGNRHLLGIRFDSLNDTLIAAAERSDGD
jgi:PilZ domain